MEAPQTTPEQRLYAGDRAREVLENEAFKAAFQAIETEIFEQWENAPARDTAGRELLWGYLQLTRKFKAQLTQTLETGKLAKLDLEHRRNLRQRIKDGWDSLTG